MLKRIKFVSLILLAAGCILTLGAANSSDKANSYFPAAKQKVNTVVITPGANSNASNLSKTKSAASTSSGAQQIPNYKEETLTMGLLKK